MTKDSEERLSRIGEYQPLLQLGQGGMGAAYLARALGIGGFERLVVVKRLHTHLLNHPDAKGRFLDEARLAACVHHANVVGVHQAGADQQGHFLVLDYVEGGSLDDLITQVDERDETIPAPIALRITVDALAGLQAVHDARDSVGRPLNMLHRDVSPHNVLVGRDGVARIADFGIAKSTQGSVTTDQMTVVGKLLYMAPEYLARQDVGPPLDVYAMGLTLRVALSGEDPWGPDADEAQLVSSILGEGVPPLPESLGIAPEVRAVVSKACVKNPYERYATARQMAEAIEALGRTTAWVASHADVAEFVEDLLGQQLEARRQQIVAEIERLGQPVEALPSIAPPAAEASDHSEVRPPPDKRGRDESSEVRTLPLWTIPVGLVAAGAAAAMIARAFADEGPALGIPAPSAPAASAATVAPTNVTGAAPSIEAEQLSPARSGVVSAAPREVVPEVVPEVRAVEPAETSKPRAPPARKPGPPPVRKAPAPGSTSVMGPHDITKRNPYR